MSKMSGYQKLAELMTKHSEVSTFKRFDLLNTLNILYLQAELVHLKEELRDSMREDLKPINPMLSESSNETCQVVLLSICTEEQDREYASTSDEGQSRRYVEKMHLSNLRIGFATEYSRINERVGVRKGLAFRCLYKQKINLGHHAQDSRQAQRM